MSEPHGSDRPSAWVQRFAGLVRDGGAVLDVACGNGRHLRLFRDRGHPVVGVDRNLEGVADLRDAPGVTLHGLDLEGDGVPSLGTFAAVVVTNYLHRPLVGWLLDAVEPGGVLIVETFARGNAVFGRPRRDAFLLRSGELLEWASRGELQVVAYEHGRLERPAMVQRICAVRRPGELTDVSLGAD